LRFRAGCSLIRYGYTIGDRKLAGFLRWKHIDSDLQTALELAIGDCYRLSKLQRPDFIIDGGANRGLFFLGCCIEMAYGPCDCFRTCSVKS
jgi:hypothetical protein